MGDLDVDALVLSEHDAIRRAFADLDQGGDEGLADRWTALGAQLEVHAAGEEEVFYPALLQDVDGTAGDTAHAVHDHDEIRHAVRDADAHDVGSEAWWTAVHAAREVTAEHLDEEERDILPAFREGVPAQERAALGERWLEFHDRHDGAEGLSGDDVDPEAYVEEHAP